MLNTALTVSPSEPESHLELWSSFSKKIIEKISEKDFVIWVILGKKAADWKEYITNKNHIVLEATHPSPFSALKDSGSQRAFIGSGIFKSVNGELLKRGFEKISW